MEKRASVLGDRSALYWARHHHEAQSTRSRWRGRDGMTNDDNYRGGDDNYPKGVVKMGPVDERKDVAGTGRNSCR